MAHVYHCLIPSFKNTQIVTFDKQQNRFYEAKMEFVRVKKEDIIAFTKRCIIAIDKFTSDLPKDSIVFLDCQNKFFDFLNSLFIDSLSKRNDIKVVPTSALNRIKTLKSIIGIHPQQQSQYAEFDEAVIKRFSQKNNTNSLENSKSAQSLLISHILKDFTF